MNQDERARAFEERRRQNEKSQKKRNTDIYSYSDGAMVPSGQKKRTDSGSTGQRRTASSGQKKRTVYHSESRNQSRPLKGSERERARREKRRRQIRRRLIAFLILAVILVIALISLIVFLIRRGGSEEVIDQTPYTAVEDDSGTDGEVLPESSSEDDSDFTLYLKEVQTRIPEVIKQDFIPVNEFSRPGIKLSEINNIVIHYVGNAGTEAASNLSYFKSLADQDPDDKNAVSASSNFLVGIEGEIIECMPIYEMAYCSNERNEDTLSIEVCHPTDDGEFTEESYNSLIWLCAWLCDELDLTENDLIRHYDVTGKECPLYYVDHPEAWEQLKQDVGEELRAIQSE